MNIFVSYTRRDGLITMPLLTRLHAHLAEICNPFIHAIEQPKLKHQQLSVVWALIQAHLVILVVSPEVYHSPWVRFELRLARLLLRPVIFIDGSALAGLNSGSGEFKSGCSL